MNQFLTDFLLVNPLGKELFHGVAAELPIVDFHNHLDPQTLADNRQPNSFTELWLAGDHYKWRAMRAAGITEDRITGPEGDRNKFLAWAETVPHLFGHPLEEWTKIELARFLEFDAPLSPENASQVWNRAESMRERGLLNPSEIIRKCQLEAACTTDDPAAPLSAHAALAIQERGFKILPTFRPDWCLDVAATEDWFDGLQRLSRLSGDSIRSFDDFLGVLDRRHLEFHQAGCRLSDFGLNHLPAALPDRKHAARLFDRLVQEERLAAEEIEIWQATLLAEMAKLDCRRGWTQQLHLGASRNNNSRLRIRNGRDAGADSVGDWQQAPQLGRYLDGLDQNDCLPEMIVYALNPADWYPVATMLGNFLRANRRLRIGPAWWFLDHRQGIRSKLNLAASTGLLTQFVGMVTDSRSLLSLSRHEWFRRIFCNWLGEQVASGAYPRSSSSLETLVRKVCLENARELVPS